MSLAPFLTWFEVSLRDLFCGQCLQTSSCLPLPSQEACWAQPISYLPASLMSVESGLMVGTQCLPCRLCWACFLTLLQLHVLVCKIFICREGCLFERTADTYHALLRVSEACNKQFWIFKTKAWTASSVYTVFLAAKINSLPKSSSLYVYTLPVPYFLSSASLVNRWQKLPLPDVFVTYCKFSSDTN